MKRIFHFMMDAYPLLLLLPAFLSPLAGYGQPCDTVKCSCSGSDMNPSGIMLGHSHPKGSWMFSYRYMSMQMRGKLSGSSPVSDETVFQSYIMSPQSMGMDMHMLMAMYGITDRLSVMVMLDYTAMNMDMTMPQGTMHHHGSAATDNTSNMSYRTSGIGDTKLYATYTLLNKQKHLLFASAGLSLPTGAIRLTGSESSMLPGQRLPYMMQPGSGTFDLLPAVTYAWSNNTLMYGAQLAAVIRPDYNALNYTWGNEATGTTWIAYRFLSWLSASARLEACAAGQIRGRDNGLYEVMEPGASPTNYGGTKASAYAGANIYLPRLANSKLSLEGGVPFYQHLNGIQLAGRFALFAGWSLSF